MLVLEIGHLAPSVRPDLTAAITAGARGTALQLVAIRHHDRRVEVRRRIDVVKLGGLDEGVQRGSDLGAASRLRAEVIAASDDGAADRAFGRVNALTRDLAPLDDLAVRSEQQLRSERRRHVHRGIDREHVVRVP